MQHNVGCSALELTGRVVQRELQKYVQAVNEKAPAMMSNKKARVALLRFFAPTQVGDKASGGSLPFDLSELV